MDYRIMISNRNYTEWYFADPEKYIRVSLPSRLLDNLLRPRDSVIESKHTPYERKWFTRDIISFNESGEATLVYSPIRNQTTIAGVLILEKNKTFGRTANKKRLLYKCIPDDKHLPAFLVAYDVKLGFSKSIVNKYVVFRFESWNDTRPHGTLVETLGDVDKIDVFYEYQLYCRSIHASITEFTNTARTRLNQHTKDEYIETITSNPAFRIHSVPRDTRIITIDPANSVDFDDAFSVSHHPTNGNTVVSVYIANVYVWMEAMNLWPTFSERVSTIYLPDRKRPMLPTILSDSLCSLQENQPRFALRMTVEITPEGALCADTATFQNVLVYVSKNHTYESRALLADPAYQSLLSATKCADPKISNIQDSHDVVMYWMVQMNTICGANLASNRVGIFRTATLQGVNPEIHADIPATLETDTRRFIQQWRNVSSQYCLYSETPIQHEIMNIHTYAHITSPIRRLVDLLNMMIFMEKNGVIRESGEHATTFLLNWTGQMDYINTAMRSIRKVQTDCELLRKCSEQPQYLSELQRGVVFDKVVRTDATFSYMVYLPDLQIVSRVHAITELYNYQTYQFQLFLFQDEENIRNKIRLHISSS
jgi:exoribonuclease R